MGKLKLYIINYECDLLKHFQLSKGKTFKMNELFNSI